MKKIISCILIFNLALSNTYAQVRLSFRPENNGFHFVNSFTTEVPGVMKTDGLCGGMVLAAFNFFRFHVPIPALTDKDIDYHVTFNPVTFSTSGTTPLIDYIFHSEIATYTNVSAFSFFGLQDPSIKDEFDKAKARIDRGEYVMLGLKMRKGVGGLGHQVLCYGYNANPKELYIYDPNLPDQEIRICIEDPMVLKDVSGAIVSDHYKVFFEEQELFINRISDRTTYNLGDNIIRNLNYAVMPPGVDPRPAMTNFGYTDVNINYEMLLPPQNTYKMQNIATFKMVEVDDAPPFANGTNVQQYSSYETNGTCDGKNQKWLLIPAAAKGTERVKAFYIINFGFLKYLEAGTDATVQTGNDNNNQRWFIQPTGRQGVYYIKSVATQTYLEMPSGFTHDKDRFKLDSFTGAANQQFAFEQTVGNTGVENYTPGSFINICSQLNPNKTLNIAGASVDNGAVIQLYSHQRGALNEQWKLILTPDHYYKIVSRLDGNKNIDITGLEGGNNSNLLLWDNADVEKQKWLIIPVVREPGNYIFFNKVSGRCIDIAGGTESDHSTIQTYLFQNKDAKNQKWRIVSAN